MWLHGKKSPKRCRRPEARHFRPLGRHRVPRHRLGGTRGFGRGEVHEGVDVEDGEEDAEDYCVDPTVKVEGDPGAGG